MSTEPTPSQHAPPGKADPGADFHYTAGQRRLAILSYGMACAGPLAFLVMALFYPQRDARVLPPLPIQAIWWALRLCAPVGAILGLIVLLRSRSQTLGYRRMGVSYAGAGVLVGALAALFLPYGTGALNELRWNNSPGQYREDM